MNPALLPTELPWHKKCVAAFLRIFCFRAIFFSLFLRKLCYNRIMKHIQTDGHWGTFSKNESLKITGTLITLRDGTLKKLFTEEDQPSLLRNATIYFCGPTPPPPGEIIGSCGPTTSSRMEPYFEKMINCGAKAFIGKGEISAASKALLDQKNGYYFSAIGGVGAFLNSTITSAKIIRFPELGPEAIYKLEVKDFPVVHV